MMTKLLTGSALVAGLFSAGIQAAEPVRSGAALGETCAGCHGTNGYSAGDSMPSIAGLSKRYLQKAMHDFKYDLRPSTIMGRIARGYSDQELVTIAAYFGDRKWQAAPVTIDQKTAVAGRKLHEERCASCHGKAGEKNEQETPRLAGQWPQYTYNQLRELHDIGFATQEPAKMHERVQKLSDAEIKALSQYYASVK
jgi:cytochrome subunit of sulfide dehydrogenase